LSQTLIIKTLKKLDKMTCLITHEQHIKNMDTNHASTHEHIKNDMSSTYSHVMLSELAY
jgi:hypothetical protein